MAGFRAGARTQGRAQNCPSAILQVACFNCIRPLVQGVILNRIWKWTLSWPTTMGAVAFNCHPHTCAV